MADVKATETPESPHENCAVACGPDKKETLRDLPVSNGDVKGCTDENGLPEEGSEGIKNCLSVTGHNNTRELSCNEMEESRSQRNSSTSDSGVYSSDADHVLSKADVEAITDAIDTCHVTEDSENNAHDKPATNDEENGIHYVVYDSEVQMPEIMRLITKDLSEPYSIYTYRYFIHNWPKLCFLAMCGTKTVGAIVCKLDLHKKMVRRGYIAMLAVDQNYRRRGIGSHLVLKAIRAMVSDDCDEVVLETEITNKSALQLYENLGFVRDKRLFRYYLNGVDALRLKLWLR